LYYDIDFIGIAFNNVRGQLYPTVGLSWPGARVRARFGTLPPELSDGQQVLAANKAESDDGSVARAC